MPCSWSYLLLLYVPISPFLSIWLRARAVGNPALLPHIADAIRELVVDSYGIIRVDLSIPL